MAITVAAVMRQVRNFFVRSRVEGTISITGGAVSPAVSAPWVAISGSAYHDGVHRMVDGVIENDDQPDETFVGQVWMLHPPDDFLKLCADIAAYDEKNAPGSFVSESFGDYSISRATGTAGTITWEQAFASRVAPYRRMFTEVDV